MKPIRKAHWVLFAALACVAAAACKDDEPADDTADAADSGGFLDETSIARASVLLNSCVSDDGFLRTQTYLRGHAGGYAYPNSDAMVACLADVSDGCAGVRACFGLSEPQDDDPCDTCMGNVAVVCIDGKVRWDCDAIDATCSAGRCIPRDGEECEEPSGPLTCDQEGRPFHCDDNVGQRGPSCPSFGLLCAPEGGHTGAGQGTGAECTARDSDLAIDYYTGVACTGDTLTACLDGRLGDLDCTRFGRGFGCQEFSGAFFCGTASECDPVTFQPACEGAQRVFCNAGKIERVDCTELGFSACGDASCVDP